MNEEGQAKASGYSWYALGVLFLVYLVNFVDRQILSILANDIKADYEDLNWETVSGDSEFLPGEKVDTRVYADDSPSKGGGNEQNRGPHRRRPS